MFLRKAYAMQDNEIKALSDLRFEHAAECLTTAKNVIGINDFKCAANRSYYAVFHAMRAVLVYDGIDMKKHSGIIAEFRRLYVKTGIFDKEISQYITDLFDIRTNSDYDDFFIISKEDVIQQVENAEKFLNTIKEYLDAKE